MAVGHVEKRGPRRWVAVYPDATKKSGRGAKSFERKVDANEFLAGVTVSQLKREWVSPGAGKIQLGTYAATWIEHRAIRETSREQYTRRVASRFKTIAAVDLCDLTPSILEQWQAGLLKRLKASTVRSTHGTLSAILKTAVRDKLIAVNPLAEVKKPPPDDDKVVPLERATVQAIHDAIAAHYRAAIWLGAACGLRQGEAFGLCVSAVDFLRRTVRIERSRIHTKEHGQHLGLPKTPSSARTVPLPAFVGEALAEHVRKWPPIRVYDDVTGQWRDDLIFSTLRGTVVGQSAADNAWERAAPVGTRFHDLRHHFASTHINAGANVLEVRDLMGHKDASETLGTYSHLFPGSEDRARQRIESAWTHSDKQGTTANIQEG